MPNKDKSRATVPGAPPAFNTGPAAGPRVTASTFAEAEKLVQVSMTRPQRAMAAASWRTALASVYERRTGPRKVALETTLAPWSQWNPVLPGVSASSIGKVFVRGEVIATPLPANDEDIAYAPLTLLAHWVEKRQLTSERLTNLYLGRLDRFNGQLRCAITVTPDRALNEARRADSEIAAGHYRGPLHGIPWGAKDLLDTAGIPTTYGAEPYRDRTPAEDAVVVKRLTEAGAVLVAKLSMGALALNDIWFGGQTMNPCARRRFVRFERRSRRCHSRGTGRLLHRQRDGREHCQPEHALRDYRFASHLWPRASHRGHDPLLVARQTGSDDAWSGGFAAGTPRDLG